jgi:hypothetical protein
MQRRLSPLSLALPGFALVASNYGWVRLGIPELVCKWPIRQEVTRIAVMAQPGFQAAWPGCGMHGGVEPGRRCDMARQ